MMQDNTNRQYSIRGDAPTHATSHRHLARRRPILARASAQLRGRVVAAFRTAANGAAASIAHVRMKTFYRSSGMAWARSLV